MAGVVAWFGLLISQPFLIAQGRRATHRKIGKLSYFIVPYVAVTSLLLARSRFQRLDEAAFARDGHSLYLPVIAVLLFVACFGLAMWNRRRAPLHARYMIGTGLALIDPIMARLLAFYTSLPPGPILYPAIGYGLTDAVLILLLLKDKDRRGRQAFLVLLAIFAIGHIGWFTIAQTAPWFAFSRWFTGA
jgi:hypothetical protein